MPDLALLDPAWLLLLLPLAVLARFSRLRLPLWRSLPRLRHPGLTDLAQVDGGQPRASRPPWLLLAILALVVLSLAQPVRFGPARETGPRPLDLVVLLDASVTMTLRDYELNGERVDRLSMARALLDEFMRDFPGRRLGLVVVGSPPAVWSPMSTDHELVRRMLARVQLTLAGRRAAIGDALALTAEHFGAHPGVVAVLISDASEPGGRLAPLDGVARLKDKRMRLHTITIGSTDRKAAEQTTAGLIYQPADLGLMQRLAKQGGGRAFHALDTGAVVQALREVLRTQLAELPAAASEPTRQSLYAWPLGLALLLLAISVSRRQVGA